MEKQNRLYWGALNVALRFEIFALLDLPQLTVNATVEVSRSSDKLSHERPTTQTHRAGPPSAHKNDLFFVALLTAEFHAAFASNISTRTVCQELREISFHGQAAAHETQYAQR